MNLLGFWLSFVKWGLIISSPLLAALFLLLPILDRLNPWEEAERIVGSDLHLCVGLTSWRSTSSDGVDRGRQRSYLLPGRAELVIVTDQGLNGEELARESSRTGFWILIFVFLVLVLTSVRFSIPTIASRIKQAQQASDGDAYQRPC